MVEPSQLMRLAIEKCRTGMNASQSPFGCAIARGDEILAVAHNTVVATTDITAHAEINAIRQACLARNNIFLDDTIVATTCEPCPMCMAALHWARVQTVYYGATIEDAQEAGFNELALSASDLVHRGASPVKLIPGLLTDECRALFDEWKRNPRARAY